MHLNYDDDNVATFDAFAAAVMPRLRHIAYAWCHDWHHSDDVVQDTMERLYAAWPRVHRGGQEYAYARTTLIRRLISENRRAWRRHESLTLDDVPAARQRTAPDAAGHALERLDALDLLRHLPVRQRAVAILRFLEDVPVSDVADLLQCSEGTVKSQAHHARRFLHQHLTDPHTPDGAWR
ncbi:sigma-70 family RNA polymerase sigma factor [Kineococcus endophyticus]|uniref:Sigma-70 family RNA polymerase sigma factor n=1 Tax=Kineococcus endophyticus TaxID=1181883 RepID=A0ABV3PCV0_9ACTN